jgi:murein DD-endopeptidase MepM/ murein hydrolase activator NlpD
VTPSRPSAATAVLVVLLTTAGALGVLAPVAKRAAADGRPVASVRTDTAVSHAQVAARRAQQVRAVDTAGRTAAAERATRSAPRQRVDLPTAITLRTALAVADRYERQQARIEAARRAREAARRARQRQAFLDRWVMPIHSYSWSAGYGEAGWMWSSGYHTGQDWTAPYGTPVYAAARGTITSAGWSDAYGNKLVITNYDGSQSWYGHLEAFERTGGTVAAGELVGYVGCTGNCYGPHLHFEIHLADGSDTDPVTWLRQHHVAL